MKTQIMLALIAACFVINAFAEGMTASLQSGDKLSVFYGTTAFKEAYAAAQDGDVITLSLGKFTDLDEAISKSIKVYGTYAFSESNSSMVNNLSVIAANVKLEGIYIYELDPSASLGLTLRSCNINSIVATNQYSNILVEQCQISDFTDVKFANNFSFRNTVFKSIQGNNLAATGYMEHCLVFENDEDFSAIYKNCILGYSPSSSGYVLFCSPSEFYHNVFFYKDYAPSTLNYNFNYGVAHSDNQSISMEIMNNYFKISFPNIPTNIPSGSDGTSVGPNGGIGFSKYPTIPRITRSEISNTADDNGNIHVVIEATSQRQ